MKKSYKKNNKRLTIRKYFFHPENLKKRELFLYGRLGNIKLAVGYCELHKCYMAKRDVKEKRCLKKKCKYYQTIEQRRSNK